MVTFHDVSLLWPMPMQPAMCNIRYVYNIAFRSQYDHYVMKEMQHTRLQYKQDIAWRYTRSRCLGGKPRWPELVMAGNSKY